MSAGLMMLAQQGFNRAVMGMDVSKEEFEKAISHITCHKNQIKHATEFQAHYQKKEQGIQESVLTPACIACFYMGYSTTEPKNCENRNKFKEVGLYKGIKHNDSYPPRLLEKTLVEEEGSGMQVAENCLACLSAYNDVYNYRKNTREREKEEIKKLQETQKNLENIMNIELEHLKSNIELLQKENKSLKEIQEKKSSFTLSPMSENFNNQSITEKIDELVKFNFLLVQTINDWNKK